MLVQWGCDLADRDGVGAYVDASKAGAPLYEKFGFVDYSLALRRGLPRWRERPKYRSWDKPSGILSIHGADRVWM